MEIRKQRSIKDIKKEITDSFMKNAVIKNIYKLADNDLYEAKFSKVSIEDIIFHTMAATIWALESIFFMFVAEITEMIYLLSPHTLKWYQQKVLRFQFPDRDLVQDKDYYDNSDLKDGDLEKLEIVKFCAVDELESSLLVKVAKGEPGKRTQLDKEEIDALNYYLSMIKDAGIKINVISDPGDKFFCEVNVYYNPLLLTPIDCPVEAAIANFISNLDFNGLLSTTKLVDAIQAVPGVELVDIISCEVMRGTDEKSRQPLGVQKLPTSGYYVVEADDEEEEEGEEENKEKDEKKYKNITVHYELYALGELPKI